jgi:hypothetical protein
MAEKIFAPLVEMAKNFIVFSRSMRYNSTGKIGFDRKNFCPLG